MAEHLTAGGENLALLPLLFSSLPVHHQQQLYYILRMRIVYMSIESVCLRGKHCHLAVLQQFWCGHFSRQQDSPENVNRH